MNAASIEMAPGPRTEAEWSDLFDGFRDLSLLQTWVYGEAKAATSPWRAERGIFVRAGMPVGLFQALVRSVPGGGLAWINRGPLWRRADDPGAPEALVDMLAALREEYVAKRRLYLRIAPAMREDEAAVLDVAKFGYASADMRGWASAALDLTADLAELRRRLHQKWRNSLNKAERGNMDVRVGEEGPVWEDFLALHRGFAAERSDLGVDVGLVTALQSRLPRGRRLAALVAYSHHGPVASVVLARYGNCAEYLAGNTTAEGRTTAAGQLLLWRAIEKLKQEGVARFDLGGMDREKTPAGIFEFKNRVGGTPYRLAGEIEAGGAGLIGRLVRWRTRRARATLA